MANNKKPVGSGVFDVARPGRGGLPASATTRSVITTNRTVVDPMVNEPQPEEQPAPLAQPAKKIIITPLHDDVEPEAVVPVQAVVAPEVPVPDEPKQVPVPEAKPPKPPEGFPEPVPDAAVKPEDTPGVPPKPEEREVDSEIARKRAARLQKMIDEEEYFLPIKTAEERRSRKVAIFGILLIVLLALAWYNTALDASLLPNTYNLPHTSFFTVK
ncbi:MAG: hypothetical protein JWN82_129 [Candidatus Saccharibacteria bacterium]|nr:hypothetical protein [Candidatus Saccharibacteria bacterium]